MAVIESILALIVTISILVTIHEFGHYWVARRCGVKVLRFSIGFGKPLFTWRGKPLAPKPVPEGAVIRTRANENLGVEFVIAAIPLGGYVKMLDEREGFVADDERHMSFNSKTPLQRIAIVVAGPLANFLLAIVAYWVLFVYGVTGIVPLLGDIESGSMAGQAGFRSGYEILAVDGKDTATWSDVNLRLFKRVGDTGEISFRVRDQLEEQPEEQMLIIGVVDWLADDDSPSPIRDLGLELPSVEIPATIGKLVDGDPASLAGLQVDDEILSVNFQQVRSWQHWVDLIRSNPGNALVLNVQRGDVEVLLELTPNSLEVDGKLRGYIGAAASIPEMPASMQRVIRYDVMTAGVQAVAKTWDMTLFTFESIGKMINGAISSSNLSGPITIARIAGASAKSGLESFINFIALLSISLGVINLLPIPVMDGGHLVYNLVELIFRRPVSERVQVVGMQLGIFIIVGIMLLAFYNDLARF